jgi:hypothetical protein
LKVHSPFIGHIKARSKDLGKLRSAPVQGGVIWQVAVADTSAGNIPGAQGSPGGWESLAGVVGKRVVRGKRVGQISLQSKGIVYADEHFGQ